jgi:hypothetical protein
MTKLSNSLSAYTLRSLPLGCRARRFPPLVWSDWRPLSAFRPGAALHQEIAVAKSRQILAFCRDGCHDSTCCTLTNQLPQGKLQIIPGKFFLRILSYKNIYIYDLTIFACIAALRTAVHCIAAPCVATMPPRSSKTYYDKDDYDDGYDDYDDDYDYCDRKAYVGPFPIGKADMTRRAPKAVRSKPAGLHTAQIHHCKR